MYICLTQIKPNIYTHNIAITFSDTLFLLRFLRNAKFSQLRARQLLESYLLTLDQHPRWFRNINIQDPGIQAFIKTG